MKIRTRQLGSLGATVLTAGIAAGIAFGGMTAASGATPTTGTGPTTVVASSMPMDHHPGKGSMGSMGSIPMHAMHRMMNATMHRMMQDTADADGVHAQCASAAMSHGAMVHGTMSGGKRPGMMHGMSR